MKEASSWQQEQFLSSSLLSAKCVAIRRAGGQRKSFIFVFFRLQILLKSSQTNTLSLCASLFAYFAHSRQVSLVIGIICNYPTSKSKERACRRTNSDKSHSTNNLVLMSAIVPSFGRPLSTLMQSDPSRSHCIQESNLVPRQGRQRATRYLVVAMMRRLTWRR